MIFNTGSLSEESRKIKAFGNGEGGRSFKHRLISAFLSTALFATAVLAGVTLNDKTVYADEPFVKTAENTGLGTGAITNPVRPVSTSSGWSGSYIYYGNFDVENDGTAEPIKYRVLSNAETKFGGETLFLDCDSTLYEAYFDEDGNVNEGATKPKP